MTNGNGKPPMIRIMELGKVAPGYSDPADLFERAPNADALWEQAVSGAKPYPSWAIDHIDELHDIKTPHGAANAAGDLVDMLLNQPPVARARYVRELAAKLGEDERFVRQTLNDIVRERGDYYKDHPEERPRRQASMYIP